MTVKIDSLTMNGGRRTYCDVEVIFSEYFAGGTAIILGGEDGPIGVATVYLDGQPPASGCVWIKDWSENEGVFDSLTKAGVIEPTGRTAPTGFVVAHEAQLLVQS